MNVPQHNLLVLPPLQTGMRILLGSKLLKKKFPEILPLCKSEIYWEKKTGLRCE